MGDGAGDHVLQPPFAKEREALGSALEEGRETVELRGDELALELPRRRLPVPAEMRGRGLVGTDENAVGLLAQIAVRPGTTHYRQLALELDEFLEGFGDDVVMQKVGDGYAVPGPGADHAAIGPSGVDDVLAADVALVGCDQPFAGLEQANTSCPRSAIDFGAEATRSRGHGAGHV